MSESYTAFLEETKKQYEALIEAGYKIEPWMGEGEPYGVDSNTLRKDIIENKHLYYLRSRAATGENNEQESGDTYMPFKDAGFKINGQEVLLNDLFRAVHDIMGHGMVHNTFSTQGEFDAYNTHAPMYSKKAQKALFLETVVYNAFYSQNKKYAPRKIYNIPNDWMNNISGRRVLDIGGSEGGWVKAITEATNNKVQTVNLDPNPGMVKSFNATPVENSNMEVKTFYEEFGEFEIYEPKVKYDVVHEAMTFQFISSEREAYIDEINSKYLKEDGLVIFEEKFQLTDKAQQEANEQAKDRYKEEFYTKEEIDDKKGKVLGDMGDMQANREQFEALLKEKYKYVEQHWDGGNFGGFIASNSKQTIDNFLEKMGGPLVADIYNKVTADQSTDIGNQLSVVTDLSGNQTEVDSNSIVTYESEAGPIRYITDENGDMVMLSDKNTLEQNPNGNIEPNFDASNKSDNNRPRINYKQLEDLWRKEGFEIGREYSHTEFIEFIEKNGSPEALTVWNLIKDKLDQFPATIMIMHQTDPRFEKVIKSKSRGKGVTVGGYALKNQIVLNSRLLSTNPERAVRTTVHELTHTVTVTMLELHKYINSDRFLKAQKSTQDKWSKIYDTVSPEQKKTLQEIFELFEEIQKSKLLEGHYGMKNINEFFAELANPEFIKELKKLEVTKSPEEKSFFERLVELVYKLFGKDVSYGADSYVLDSLSTLLEGDVDYNKYHNRAEPLFDSLEKTYQLNTQYASESELLRDANGNVIGVKPEVLEEIRKEREQIKTKARANGTWMKAPNGENTNLNEDQWVDVRTKRFKDWFGDWQNDPGNASKVVDENGEPLVVHHGTNADFNEFRNNVSWFSDSLWYANQYKTGEDGKIVDAFLNIKNPADLDMYYEHGFDKLAEMGYDGTILLDQTDGLSSRYTTTNPNQIKSATDNIGTYSTTDNNINFQIIGELGAAELSSAENIMANNKIAKQMQEAGKDAKTIKIATGWEVGADGKWRYEILDGALKIDNSKWYDGKPRNTEDGVISKVSDIYDNAVLFEAYPQIKNMQVIFSKEIKTGEGMFVNDTIYLSYNQIFAGKADLREILVHEIQHAIQYTEGFSTGGDLGTGAEVMGEKYATEVRTRNSLMERQEKIEGYINDPLLNKIQELLTEKPEIQEYEFEQIAQELGESTENVRNLMEEVSRTYETINIHELKDIREDISEDISNINAPYGNQGAYQALAGETEARNVQTRVDMTVEERRQTLLEETEDIPRDEQVFVYGGRMQRSIEGPASTEKLTAISEFLGKTKLAESVTMLSNKEVLDMVKRVKGEKSYKELGIEGGKIKGFTYQGNIYLNTEAATLDTPLHEFGHLYNKWLKENRREIYNRGIQLVQQEIENPTSEIKDTIDFVRAAQPSLTGEALAEEILTELMGKKGLEALNSKKKKGPILEWLEQVWDEIKGILGLSQYTTEEILGMNLNDYTEAAATDLMRGRPMVEMFSNKILGNKNTRIEVTYIEESRRKELEEQGVIRVEKDLTFMRGAQAVTTSPDDMVVGTVSVSDTDGKNITTIRSTEGTGGLYFITKFKEVWAFKAKNTATSIARAINKARAENGGRTYFLLVKGSDDKLLSNPQGVTNALNITTALMDAGLVTKSDMREAVIDALKAHEAVIDIPLNASIVEIKENISSFFKDEKKITFEKRGDAVKQLVGNLNKTKSFRKNRKEIAKFLGVDPKQFTKAADVRNAVALISAEGRLVGLNSGDIYAAVEINHDVEVVEGDHEVFEASIVEIDENGNKVQPKLILIDGSHSGYTEMQFNDGRKFEDFPANKVTTAFNNNVLGRNTFSWGRGTIREDTKP